MQEYDVDIRQGKDLMVLDVLETWSRRIPTVPIADPVGEGVCGSDGMNMNGRTGSPVSRLFRNW